MFGKTSFGWQAFVAAVVLFTTDIASAQSANSALETAQTFVDDAGALMDAGKYADACPKLEQATALLPDGIGAKMALGECYVGLGRLASAWEQYNRAEALAIAKKNASRADEARAEMSTLELKLAKVTIVVPRSLQSVPGLSVRFDKVEQSATTWGTPIRVDKGRHLLEASAPGRITLSNEVNIEKDRDIVVPELEMVPTEKPIGPPKTLPAPSTPTPAPKPPPLTPPPPRNHWKLPVGIAGLGIGAAGFIAGSVLGAMASSKHDASNAEGQCNEQNICKTKLGVSLRDEAFGYARGSNAAFFVGGAFVAGGIVLIAIPPRPKKDSTALAQVSMFWNVDVGLGWIDLRGTW